MKPAPYALLHLALTGLLLLGAWVGRGDLFTADAFPFVLFAISLASVAGLVAYMITYSGIQKSVKLFVTYLIGGMLFKLMFGIFSVTIVALKFKEFAAEYVLSYFGAYFLLLGLEVFSLMRASQEKDRREKATKAQKSQSE